MFRPAPRSSAWLVAAAALLAAPGAVAKKKKDAPPPPKVGWVAEEGWTMKCWFPPNWAAMSETERKLARARGLDEMKKQWSGGLEDGVSFPEEPVDTLEVTLLGRPGAIEGVAAQNLEYCQKVATGQGDAASWESWIRNLPGKLTAGECLTPFDYRMFDYLDIFREWNRTVPMCEGDRVMISATSSDRYRVRENGPWINAGGDPEKPTAGNEAYPCNQEGCFEGMFFAKFVTEEGVTTVLPVGLSMVFAAPANGELTYGINEKQFYDNRWFKTGGIEDHTAIEISPQ